MSENNGFIELKDVHFSRGEREIFSGIDLQIPKGKITAIMGPSGTGKTTLLKLIAGQIRPEQGEIFVDGQNIGKLSRRALYEMRQKMGMLFQSGALLNDLNVFDNVAFPLREHTQLPEALIATLVLMKLQAVGLQGAKDLMPSELSGGMARRVALARAIAMEPEMIFYDEPFVGQDPITMGVLIELIKKLNQSLGLTSVVVSHDVDEVLSIADYVCVISGGKIIAQGDKQQIFESENAFVHQFVKGLADGPVPFHYGETDYQTSLASMTVSNKV